MGSIVTRAIVMIAGYAYPAYECFKGVERNRPDIENLRFWCQYWMIIALLTIFERVGDSFVSWIPMYSEAKLAFIIYLWYPKTMGATYVYSTFLKPYVSSHEPTIDRTLNELKAKAGDLVFTYWQKGAMYVQTRFFELLHFVASQSPNPPAITENLNANDDGAAVVGETSSDKCDESEYDIVEAESTADSEVAFPNNRRRTSILSW